MFLTYSSATNRSSPATGFCFWRRPLLPPHAHSTHASGVCACTSATCVLHPHHFTHLFRTFFHLSQHAACKRCTAAVVAASRAAEPSADIAALRQLEVRLNSQTASLIQFVFYYCCLKTILATLCHINQLSGEHPSQSSSRAESEPLH